MTYGFLSDSLHVTADRVAAYFHKSRGVSNLKAEWPLPGMDDYCPTLSGDCSDGCILCVEVIEEPISPSYREFLDTIRDKQLPVRGYIVMPSGGAGHVIHDNQRYAEKKNLGFIEYNQTADAFHVAREAVSQSLVGLRQPDGKSFPKQLRDPLAQASHTFLSGNPVKGCSEVWDQVEHCSRLIAIKCREKGLWTPPAKMHVETASWSRVMDAFRDKVNYSALNQICPALKRQLLAKVVGATPDRNEYAHEPKTRSARAKRDARVRTHFESAVDLLHDLLIAARPLKLRL